MSTRSIYKDQTAKTTAVEENATKKNDTGSPEVQVAVLTNRITSFTAATDFWRWLQSVVSFWIILRKKTKAVTKPSSRSLVYVVNSILNHKCVMKVAMCGLF